MFSVQEEAEAENNVLSNSLRDKEEELGEKEAEIERLEQQLADFQREAPKATPTLNPAAAQTTEPYPKDVR